MKHKVILVLVFIVAIFSFIKCSSDPSVNIETEKSTIMSVYNERLIKIQSGKNINEILDAYMKPLAEDAVWMPPNSPEIKGKEAIRMWAENFFKNYTLSVDSIPENHFEIGSHIAIRKFRSVGKYISQDSRISYPYDQKYIDYFRRGEDGSWKQVVHMWNSNNIKSSIWK